MLLTFAEVPPRASFLTDLFETSTVANDSRLDFARSMFKAVFNPPEGPPGAGLVDRPSALARRLSCIKRCLWARSRWKASWSASVSLLAIRSWVLRGVRSQGAAGFGSVALMTRGVASCPLIESSEFILPLSSRYGLSMSSKSHGLEWL